MNVEKIKHFIESMIKLSVMASEKYQYRNDHYVYLRVVCAKAKGSGLRVIEIHKRGQYGVDCFSNMKQSTRFFWQIYFKLSHLNLNKRYRPLKPRSCQNDNRLLMLKNIFLISFVHFQSKCETNQSVKRYQSNYSSVDVATFLYMWDSWLKNNNLVIGKSNWTA